MSNEKHRIEKRSGKEFDFGKNWNSFISLISDQRIEVAENNLKDMLGVNDLEGRAFLDIGCGSGLFSLAAKNLNAAVHSFDLSPECIRCTELLKAKYHPHSNSWFIEEGSVLDISYLSSLHKFDIVHAWGVLHHTGNLGQALENVMIPLNPNGTLFIAIYNDQGWKSQLWLGVKKLYNSHMIGQVIIICFFYPFFILKGLISDLVKLKNPVKRYREYRTRRGMSMIHDWRDWLGGLPYEVATPAKIRDFYESRGFRLVKLKETRSLGNNQFIFYKNGEERLGSLDATHQ